jgi:hypothetical protein
LTVQNILSDRTLSTSSFLSIFELSKNHGLLLDLGIASKFLIRSMKMKKKLMKIVVEDLFNSINNLSISKYGKEFDQLDLIYPVLIHYMKENRFNYAKILYRQARKMNINFSEFQMNYLVTRAIRNREIEFSDELLADAEEMGLHFTHNMKQFLLSAYVHVSLFDHAMNVFRDLTKDSKAMDFPFYSILLESLKKNSHTNPKYHDYIREILTHLDDKIINNANFRFYDSILSAVGEIGNVDLGKKWMAKLLSLEITVSDVATNGLLQAFSKSHMFDEGFHFVQTMEKKYRIKPNIYSFSLLLDCCENQSHILKVIEEMGRQRVAMTSVFYSSVIRSLCSHKKKHVALEFYELLKNQNLLNSVSDQDIIQTLVIAYFGYEDVVNSLYRDCKKLRIQPSKYLVLLFGEYSPEFRDDLIEQIMKQTKASVLDLFEQNKELLSTLLYILKANQDARFLQLQSKLNMLGIFVTPKIPSNYRLGKAMLDKKE